MAWNQGLSCGFGNFLLSMILTGSAYLFLILCVSEMVSALPFAGGAYGLPRCILGFYPGFLLGCCEACELIISVSQAALSCALMICDIFEITSRVSVPLICIFLYLVSSGVQIQGGILFWRVSNILAVASCIFLLLFLAMCSKHASFERNVVSDGPFFHCQLSGFLLNLPLATWFYGGVETLPYVCDLAKTSNPKISVPRGCIACISTLLVSSFSILFAAASLPPGVQFLQQQIFPLNSGFMDFGISFQTATLFSFLATFASMFGFMFSYGRLLYFLATSGLLPTFLSHKWKSHGTPAAAIITGSVVSYGASLLFFYFPVLGDNVFNICILPAFVGYCAQCVVYIHLRRKFSKLKRAFHSPFGIYGAVFALCAFTVCIVSVIGFQQDGQVALTCNAVVLSLLSVYYFMVAKERQTFSAEEQKIYGNARVIHKDLEAAAKRCRERNQRPARRRSLGGRNLLRRSISVYPQSMSGSQKIRHSNRNEASFGTNAVLLGPIEKKTEIRIFKQNDEESHNIESKDALQKKRSRAIVKW